MKPLLLIKTGGTIPTIKPVHGDFEDWFSAGLAFEPIMQVDVYRGQELPDHGTVSSVVITGSVAMVSHREAWSERTADWLLRALDLAMPVLGVCYGHQLLAQALGGLVGPNPLGRQMGTVQIDLESGFQSDILFMDYPACFKAQTSHLESVLELPPGAVRLGRTGLDENHVVKFADNAWGIQYHPEFSSPVMCEYIRLRSAELIKEGFDPQKMTAAVIPTPLAASILPAFTGKLVNSAAA